MSRALKWAIASAILLLAGKAGAQDPTFGDSGHVAISAERLFGYLHTSEARSIAGGGTMTRSQDTFTLLANPVGAFSGYAWPRIGFDGFIVSRISLGLSAGYFRVSNDAGSTSGFLFAPRVGYVARLAPKVALWPRAGITFEQASSGDTIVIKQSTLAFTLEAPLAVLIGPRMAILVGPTLEVGLTGSRSVAGVSNDDKFTEFGIQVGLLISI